MGQSSPTSASISIRSLAQKGERCCHDRWTAPKRSVGRSCRRRRRTESVADRQTDLGGQMQRSPAIHRAENRRLLHRPASGRHPPAPRRQHVPRDARSVGLEGFRGVSLRGHERHQTRTGARLHRMDSAISWPQHPIVAGGSVFGRRTHLHNAEPAIAVHRYDPDLQLRKLLAGRVAGKPVNVSTCLVQTRQILLAEE